MWFNRDLFQRVEQLKARHNEDSEFTAKELNSVRKRILTLEKQVVELGWVSRRVKTLDSLVNDLMNRE